MKILFKKLKRFKCQTIPSWIRWNRILRSREIRKLRINLDFLYVWSLVNATFATLTLIFLFVLGLHMVSFNVIYSMFVFRCSLFVLRHGGRIFALFLFLALFTQSLFSSSPSTFQRSLQQSTSPLVRSVESLFLGR